MNRIIMSWAVAAALLIAITVTSAKTAEMNSPASQAAAAVSESVLWSFGASGDGYLPQAGLLADKWGNLYGTTDSGGANAKAGVFVLGESGGTVFELSPPTGGQTQWREKLLWSFGASGDGAAPVAGLLADKWGNLYGTTYGGGANTNNSCPVGCGTVFELSSSTGQQTQWRERVLWSFGASGDGYLPQAGLIADEWGNLFGTTYDGGANSCLSQGCGTVFELSPPTGQQTQWRERVLWSFGVGGDGYFPFAGLLADKRGNLFGTTANGGTYGSGSLIGFGGAGTVFELSPPAGQQTPWHERVLWNFGASDDGADPQAGLIADKWGNLYGTTELGGANSCDRITCGTVFELSPPDGQQQTPWRENVLWSFGASGDGQFPYAGLLVDKWGNLYGTTNQGGANGSNAGTIFKLSPPLGQQAPWRENVLWSFGASGDGVFPKAGLLADKWGNLYSTTSTGGAYNFGTVFELELP